MISVEIAGVTIPQPDSVFVAGEWVPAGDAVHQIVSPATGQPVAEVALPSGKHALSAVEAARTAGMGSWASLPVAARAEICARFCTALEGRLRDMETVWAVEAGMPVRYSKTLHRFAAVTAWQTALACAAEVLRDDVRSSPLGEVIVRREPAGVVVAVMAYNGPLVTMATKAIPALLAGCPVIVKAAIESQLIMRIVADCAAGAGFPAGALSILCGHAELGRQLTASPDVDMVSLTGGRAAAQQIIEATRPRLARTHLELGGKSPALILDDAPVGSVLKSLVPGATSGTGQVCAALSRVLVPEQRHDELAAALTGAWRALVIGDPLDPATQIGPVATPAVLDRTEQFISRATAQGATVLAGGGRPAARTAGWYFEPTLITGVDRDSDLARNEVFGPVTALLSYRGLDDGIDLANDTSYGLAATVYTSDRDQGLACARRIRAGSVAINTFGPALTAPYGGVKGSGWGREAGPEGIAEFTELKQVLVGPI
ncbi:MAG TPA: aldehyde dehydrogenase family protein [Streptosporangiaceae bacterium]|nr:aldehyde dehydrogenase family protein [Streptosporangiaceae bacterium]